MERLDKEITYPMRRNSLFLWLSLVLRPFTESRGNYPLLKFYTNKEYTVNKFSDETYKRQYVVGYPRDCGNVVADENELAGILKREFISLILIIDD
jgi:hypothetical protein